MIAPEIKWACIRRLEAALENGTGLNYPQAAYDADLALKELHHFKDDAEFLREEKARVWGSQVAGEITPEQARGCATAVPHD